MFREMRRKNQLLSDAEVLRILEAENAGVLSLIGDNGYPYGVPISYVYYDNKFYFHSAKSGHKIDAIIKNQKASFTIIEKNTIVKEEYTTYFRSVIAFGKVRIIEDEEEQKSSLLRLADKFNPGEITRHLEEIKKGGKALYMLQFDIEHITGKEAIELVRERN